MCVCVCVCVYNTGASGSGGGALKALNTRRAGRRFGCSTVARARGTAGTKFSCFTTTKVRILTPEELPQLSMTMEASGRLPLNWTHGERGAGTQFTCFTSTQVQVLTLNWTRGERDAGMLIEAARQYLYFCMRKTSTLSM